MSNENSPLLSVEAVHKLFARGINSGDLAALFALLHPDVILVAKHFPARGDHQVRDWLTRHAIYERERNEKYAVDGIYPRVVVVGALRVRYEGNHSSCVFSLDLQNGEYGSVMQVQIEGGLITRILTQPSTTEWHLRKGRHLIARELLGSVASKPFDSDLSWNDALIQELRMQVAKFNGPATIFESSGREVGGTRLIEIV